MRRFVLVLACSGLLACGRASTPAEPPEATPDPSAAAARTVEQAERLVGSWQVVLTPEEEQQRTEALAQLGELGDSAHVRSMRDHVQKAAEIGMSVTDEQMVLHLVDKEVVLTWTLVHDQPGGLAVETTDAMGLTQTWDVRFDGDDELTMEARSGTTVSRFRRLP